MGPCLFSLLISLLDIKSMDLILTVTFNNFCLGSQKKIDVDGSEVQITV